MGFMLLCGGPWWRQHERRAESASGAGTQPLQAASKEVKKKKRETLQKKSARPASPDVINLFDNKTPATTADAEPSAVELDVESPVHSASDQHEEIVETPSQSDTTRQTPPLVPPDCAELPTNPARTSPPAPSLWIKQRRATLPGCPPFLVPGPPYSHDAQAQRRPTAATLKPATSDSLLESTLADWQLSSPTSLTSPSSPSSPLSPSTGRSGSSTLSPLTYPTPASSQTSLPLAGPDTSRRPSLGPIAGVRSSPRLAARRSSSNMDQLLARHALLESRRQILLQLHEVEQEQERILEELAAMPEEDEGINCDELGGGVRDL